MFSKYNIPFALMIIVLVASLPIVASTPKRASEPNTVIWSTVGGRRWWREIGAGAVVELLTDKKKVENRVERANYGEEVKYVAKQQNGRRHHYKCPEVCYPGDKGKWKAYKDCHRGSPKCVHLPFYALFKCIVKKCRSGEDHGWSCSCPSLSS